MAEMSWTVEMRGMDVGAFREMSTSICQRYVGVEVEVELEEADCMTAFFEVPEDDDGPAVTLEVSIYDLGRDGRVLSVEEEASDNAVRWNDACQLGEDIAELLGGRLLDQ
ncbi:MAG TPA: hypothetical protein QGF58_13880 [Myxococcota bacterium]|nr:hypothetical protein [Myxococcota bacterium]